MSAREVDAPRADRLLSTVPSGPQASRSDPRRRRAREPPRSQVGHSDDGELIRRVGEGDRKAFDELYRRFARSVLGLALRRLGDRSRAEDATQETFAAIWRTASTYRPERGPGAPWLFAVARNAIVDQIRIRVGHTDDVPDRPSAEPGPHEHAESDWVSWRVHRALEELPAHERALIELAYWSELSQSEIAAHLNLPLGTVKTRTRSALKRLAELLERDDFR
jgi:RNA polymerase sigma-70 factor (ECF subfamily)